MGWSRISKSRQYDSIRHNIFGKSRLISPERAGDVYQQGSNFSPVPERGTQVCERTEASGSVPNSQRKPLKREGLSLLTSPPEANEHGTTYNLDLIAIHGLNGHPRDTWTAKDAGGEVFWLEDFLPKALPGARIFTYGYDSRTFFSPSTGDTAAYAKGLLDELSLERRSPVYASRPIVFICHSMGGLVCKQSLVIANNKRNTYQWVLDSTKAIFFFGTPHHGSDIADTVLSASPLLRLFDLGIVEFVVGRGKLLRTDLIKELSAKSKALDELCDAFVERTEKVTSIVTFYELNTIHGLIRAYREFETYAVIDPLSAEEQHCLESLVLSSFGDRVGPQNQPAKNTCEWVLSIRQFNEWRDGLPPLLWISGELGCGKTTLMSFLKNRMPQQGVLFDNKGNKVTRKSTVFSFFCEEKNKSLMNARAILQGLVWDIVSQRHDLIDHVLKEFQFSRPWSYNQLWRSFQAILDDPKIQGACIIIDALDECDKRDRRRLLEDLGVYLGKKSKDDNIPINIVVSSRPSTIGNLKELGAYSAFFKLDEDKVLRKYIAADIRRFVHDELLNSDQFNSQGRPDRQVKLEALASTIATKSEGSFLWATLILEEMSAKSFIKIKDVEDFITTCPTDFYGIYHDSLARVNQTNSRIVLKSLHIIVAARRPLTWVELKTALAIEEGHQTLEDVQQAIDDLEDIEGYFKNVLSSLIRVGETTITLRHQAVKDFLLNRLASIPKSDPRSVFSMSSENAEQTLASCCIRFLSLNDFGKKRSAEDEEIELWQDSGLGNISFFPDSVQNSPTEASPDYQYIYYNPESQFYEYAASNWAIHYLASKNTIAELSDAALKLSTSTTILSNWSHQFRKSYWGFSNLPESLDPLIVSVYLGHTSIVTRLLADKKFDSSLSAAIALASRMGYSDIVELLINHGVPSIRDMHDGRSAFSWACVGGFIDIADTLLARDKTLINISDANGHCPLSLAVQYEHVDMVDKLLGTDGINLKDAQGTTPLFFAFGNHDLSATECKIFFKLLHDPRTDVTVRDNHGRSVLSYLCEYGATKAIQGLLDCPERKADIQKLLHDPGDTKGLSPLSYVATWGHLDAIRLLCTTAQIDAQLRSVDHLDGANVFDLAAKNGRVHAIRELARYYPQGVHSRDRTGRTPLSVAMWGTDTEVLRALLDAGAEVDCPDDDGRAPISFGPSKTEMVKLLVEEFGADINLADRAGHTPLWYASRLGGRAEALLREMGARL
ncbi:hypothetical protein MMC17_000629 [Xylographa soralifera]|nr:hypothetical protein [Xylographa soralifera]